MTKQAQAIALCRVSSIEQLLSNSLPHQKDNVLKAAETLDVVIPKDGIWAGQVSSKVGVNFKRKDLLQMFDYAKAHKSVKYLIVQEVDRFMRSPEEQTYWYVRFWYELKVRVWFADKPELNEDTHIASLLRYMEGWRAAGSNEERKNKSINGQTAAIKEGRYTCSPKPGYKKGTVPGVHEIHPVRGPALQIVLVRIAEKRVTPTQGLVELNNSAFMSDGHSHYKMDKFKKIVTDPYNAGIIDVDKQVKARNESGLHEPLITLEQYYALVRVMENRKQNQNGPRKNGNPEYPLSNHVTCELCINRGNGRYVGFTHSNGKGIHLYHKYRCRACKRYITRVDLHNMVIEFFEPINKEKRDAFLNALNKVWKEKEGQTFHDADRIKRKISLVEQEIAQHVSAITDPANQAIRDNLRAQVAYKKQEIVELNEELERVKGMADTDKDKFLSFAFDFINNVGQGFLDYDLSKEHRVRCKLLLFPAGFYLNAENKVYTPEISPIYGLASNKKDLPKLEKSLLVRVKRL